MKHSIRVVNLLVVIFLLAATLFSVVPAQPVSAAGNIVISQVYGWGGGGPTNSYFAHDYIELFNAGVTTVDLTGWSLQWNQYKQNVWGTNPTPLSGRIAPGHYFLVQESDQNPVGSLSGGLYDLPITPDLLGNTAIGSINGVVALLDTTTLLVGPAPDMTHVVDLVSYEPSTADTDIVLPSWTPIITAGTHQVIYSRKDSGCANTQNNTADFDIVQIDETKRPAANPGPRNNLTPPHECQAVIWPQVTGTVPASGQINVPTTTSVTIQFNNPVTASASSFDLLCNGTLRAFSLSGAAPTTTYILQPSAPLALKTLCTVTVKRQQIVDAANNSPLADYIFSFSTTAPPTDITLQPNRFYFRVPKGARIANFIVADVNLPNETFTFQLVPGPGSTDNRLFKIVPNGLATNVVFRSTARIVYSVRVRATDSIGQSVEKPLKLYLSQKPVW